MYQSSLFASQSVNEHSLANRRSKGCLFPSLLLGVLPQICPGKFIYQTCCSPSSLQRTLSTLSYFRLLTRGRLCGNITSMHLTSSWQPAATIRPCSTKAPQQEKNESTETSPAIAEKNGEVEVSSGPSLADMSRDVSYR